MSAAKKNPKNTDTQSVNKFAGYEQHILDTSSIGVLITRMSDGTILYANKAIGDLLGIPDVDSVIGSPVPNFYWDPEERQVVIQRFRAEGSVSQYPLRTRHPDNSMVWVSISIQLFNYEGEQVFLSEIVDINERKRAEEALQTSEQRFHSLYDNATIGLYRTTPDGRILTINPTGLKLLGFDSFEELARRNLEETGFEEKDARKNFREKLEREGVIEQESVWTKKDGAPIFVRESSAVFRDENGKILYYDGSFEDITEQKRAEEALHLSEERFRRFTEATVEGLVFHEQGKIVDANPAALAMFGLSDNTELLGRNLLEFIVPEFHKAVLQQMQLEDVQPYEVQCVRKNGSIFPVETSTRTYKVGDHIIRASSIRDISMRKQAEARLNESEARYQLLSESTIEGIVIHDKGTLLDANQTFATMFGYEQKEVIGMSAMDFLTPETREITAQNIRSGYEKPYDVMGLRKDGATFPVEITGKVIPYQGRTVRVAALRDITERKQAEARLSESEARYQLLSEATTEGIAIHEKGIVLDVNQNSVTMFGYEQAEFIGMAATDFFTPESREIVVNNIRSGYEKPYDVMGLRKDGTTFPIELTGKAIPYQGRMARITALRDITERKHLEAQVQEAFERRGYQVQVGTEISQEVAAASEVSDLFDRVVTLTKERLGYYHTQLLRYDSVQDAVVLINGYGETGKKMLAGGHKMPLGAGLIGTAAESGQTVMRPTLAEDPDWRPNPLLPETKGEISVPIKFGEQILGVLDVQSDQAGALTEDDRLLLEGLCGQIAIAMHSAELVDVIRENESLLAEALKTARLAHWEYDVEKDLFTFNDHFYSIFHTTAEKAGGYQLPSARYAELFVHPDDMEVVGAEIGKALSSTERVYNAAVDHRILYEDGSVGYITVKLIAERDENGKIIRLYGANQDITERKQAEEALRRSEQEMSERLEEVNRLYRAMSHEGWQDYRNTADLPAGFMFDQAGTRPVDETVLADELFANIPMRVLGGEVVGTLTVANDPQHPTSPEDYTFLQQVSDQIALALESARLSAQTQSALAQSEKLFVASRSIAQAADLQELLKATVETLNIPAISRAGLELFSYNAAGELDRMTLAATWHAAWWKNVGNAPEAVGRSLTANVLKLMPLFLSPIPMFFNDLYHDERVDSAAMQIAKSQNYHAIATLPLFVGTQQIGVVTLTAEEPHNFTQDEIRLFTALAPQIATVLENRRQFERAQQQAERESTLNLISQKIQSATTVEAVLQIAARELGHALGAPMTIAQLSMKDKK